MNIWQGIALAVLGAIALAGIVAIALDLLAELDTKVADALNDRAER